MLFDPDRHEVLGEVAWDASRVRDAIRSIVHDIERHCVADGRWPVHPLDDEGDTPRTGAVSNNKCNTGVQSDGGVAMEKCYSHLSAVEREEISRGMATGSPIRSIARRLGRSPSTVSRELRRNAARPERYLATAAQWRAQQRARTPRRRRKLAGGWLRHYVDRRLRDGWSPQQIAARLRRDYPEDMRKRISHETIYAAIYIVPRGELRRTLIGCLRQHRKVRRGRRLRDGLNKSTDSAVKR